MTDGIIKQIKVFIASPSGLDDERKATQRIVEEINQSHSDRWRCQLKLVGWEFTLPGNGRAQSLINRDLDTCTYFIGVIWDKWGSKPRDGDGKYTSGFEEEFERARTHAQSGTFKNIYLFFKNVPEERLFDAGPQLEKVQEFRRKCIEQRDPLFKDFDTLSDFERKVRHVLEAIGWQETEIGKAPEPISAPASDKQEIAANQVSNDEQAKLFDPTAIAFLQTLSNRVGNWDATSSSEVARLRLIASTLSRSGNDEFHLGPHDANLLFARRDDFEFSNREILCIARAGVAAFHYQNSPLWHWLPAIRSEHGYLSEIFWLAFVGESRLRVGAIRLLHRLGETLPPKPEIFKHWRIFFSEWLTTDDKAVFEAAAKLMEANAQINVASEIEELIVEVPQDRLNDAIGLILSIVAKLDANQAIEKLLDHDPAQVTARVVETIFRNPPSISTATLQRCAKAKSDTIRAAANRILFDRGEVSLDQAKELASSSDFGIRLVALEFLEGAGEKFEDSDIKKLLVQRRPRGGLLSFSSNDDATHFTTYQLRALKKLPFEDLKQKLADSDIYSDIELLALCERYGNRAIPLLLVHVRDGFKSFFVQKMSAREKKLGPLASALKADELESFTRKKLLTIALDTLAKSKTKSVLGEVRAALDNHETNYSVHILKYLASFGDWSDKGRISKFNDLYNWDSGSLLSSALIRPKFVGQALHKVAKDRLADLLNLDLALLVRREILAAMSPSEFRRLDDALLLRMLYDKNDDLRKVLALKCCLGLPRNRIVGLLRQYLEGEESRFYNVIHWLDLAASMPKTVVKKVATAELLEL